MRNTQNNVNATATQILHVCARCGQTGKDGARWNFFVGDSQTPQRVHKPCGEMLQESAPKDVRTALIPSPQLRQEWREKRLSKGFWNTAFANAKPLEKSATPVAAPELAPAIAA